jgi:hypothetical protein
LRLGPVEGEYVRYGVAFLLVQVSLVADAQLQRDQGDVSADSFDGQGIPVTPAFASGGGDDHHVGRLLRVGKRHVRRVLRGQGGGGGHEQRQRQGEQAARRHRHTLSPHTEYTIKAGFWAGLKH